MNINKKLNRKDDYFFHNEYLKWSDLKSFESSSTYIIPSA